MSLSIAQVVETDLSFKKSPNVQFPSKGDFLLGTIKVRGISKSGPAHEFYASPAWNINYIPCKGEHVIVVQGLAKSGNGSSLDTHYYYLGPINIQGNIHLNPLPDIYTVSAGNSYTTSAAPKINAPKPYSAGRNFVEKLDIKNLQPYEGDLILHGRHGQALRFSSGITGDTSHYQESPFWKGSQGSPITILSNGYTTKSGPNQFVIEDPDKTKSSIILSSDQQFSTIPMSQRNIGLGIIPISLFKKPQIIVSSDRLVLNAKDDSVIISGKKTVSIATPNWAADMDKMFTQIERMQIQLTSLTSQVTILTSTLLAAATADLPVATPIGLTGASINVAGTTPVITQLSSISSELANITSILATLKQ